MKFLKYISSIYFRGLVLCPAALIVWSVPVCSQLTISVEEVLAKSDLYTSDKWVKEGIRFLDEEPQDLPYLEKLEFRSETDEFDLGRQEYLFRSSFNSSKMRKFHEQEIAISRQELLIKHDNYVASIISAYHFQTAKWYYIEIEKQQLLEEKNILEDKKIILQRLMNNSLDIDLEEFLKLENDLQEIRSALLRIDHQKATIISQLLGEDFGIDSIQLSAPNWLSFGFMHKTLSDLKGQFAQNRLLFQQQLKVDKAALKEKQEKAESQKIIDFVQIKYAGRDNLEFGNEISLGFGINIPTRSSRRVKQNEARLDMIEEQVELDQLQWELSQELKQLYAHFDLLKKEYNVLQEYIDINERSKTYEKYKTIEGIEPLSLLSLKESILKNQQKLIKIEKEAVLTYLTIISRLNAFPTNGREANLLIDKS
ncbi:MAG: hypothetical protein MK226_01175 [Saprospiraceae bacterium]|nr:hypothetical protein [Saprospiraceae bacterium]